MDKSTKDIVIIGAGLTGLALAYFLKNSGRTVHLIEARAHLGGRILTAQNQDTPPLEMGATWLGRKHTALFELLKTLDLEVFEQTLSDKAIYEPISTSPPQLVSLPPNNDPSFRIKNGTNSIIQALANNLNQEQISLNTIVSSISETEDHLRLHTNQQTLKAKIVVSTLPPFLFLNTIDVQPKLPETLTSIMTQTHTWMGDSIKVSLSFAEPFWRTNHWSGTIFSNVGPIPEMYDHADFEDNKFALKGFLNGAYYSVSKAERLALVLNQLRKYYGTKVDEYLHYEEKVWRQEPFTFTPYQSHILPHQNNGNPIYQQAFLNNKLYVAGSETASQFPGYMDGAIRSAQFVANALTTPE